MHQIRYCPAVPNVFNIFNELSNNLFVTVLTLIYKEVKSSTMRYKQSVGNVTARYRGCQRAATDGVLGS